MKMAIYYYQPILQTPTPIDIPFRFSDSPCLPERVDSLWLWSAPAEIPWKSKSEQYRRFIRQFKLSLSISH